MEVKVWVGGLQRVVSGAGWDTTCQDVVIALAHAMGRTGRFTLLEKWRDNERPLTPSECPLQVLGKWGEFAPEVRFVLYQADSHQQQQRQSLSRERLVRKARGGVAEKSASLHGLTSPVSSCQGAENSVKRSLTFSGVHHNPEAPEDSAGLGGGASMEASTSSKLRKLQQGPVPQGELRHHQQARPQPPSFTRSASHSPSRPAPKPLSPLPSTSAYPSPHSSTQVRQVRGILSSAVPPSSSSSAAALPSPTHHTRRPSPTRPGESHPPMLDPVSSSSGLSAHHLRDAGRPSAFQPPLKNVQTSSSHSKGFSPLSEGPSLPQSLHLSYHSRIQPQPGSLLLPTSRADPHNPHDDAPSSPLSKKKSVSPRPQAESFSCSSSTAPSSQQDAAATAQQPHQVHPESLSSSDDSDSHYHYTKPLPVSPRGDQDSDSSCNDSGDEVPTTCELYQDEIVPDSKPTTDSDGLPSHSQGVPLQLEEYDLDHNFPGSGGSHVHKDWNHNLQRDGGSPLLESLEYRLEDGLESGHGSGQGQGQGQLEGEHAKLLRLVHMQEQRLKTQESQIGLLNTEISSLEDEGMEYEDKLHVIMEELLLQENRQRELEPELQDLEDWEGVLRQEEQTGIHLTLELASCKAAVLEQDDKLQEVKQQETELLQQLELEEAELARERERQKKEEEEVRATEEEERARTQEEVVRLEAECRDLKERSCQDESALERVEEELSVVEAELQDKRHQLESLEGELTQENIHGLNGSASPLLGAPGPEPGPSPSVAQQDSQKMLRRILEEGLSPRLFPAGEGADNSATPPPAPPALLASFATSTQSGVWV